MSGNSLPKWKGGVSLRVWVKGGKLDEFEPKLKFTYNGGDNSLVT